VILPVDIVHVGCVTKIAGAIGAEGAVVTTAVVAIDTQPLLSLTVTG